MRSMQQQLGNLGTISAFACRHRETKKNLCRGGRSQDLPNTHFQPAVRHLCTVWPSHSQIFSLSTAMLALGKAGSRMEPNMHCRGLTDLGDVMLCPKKKHARELQDGQAHCDEADLFARLFWMRRSHSTQAQSTASHCRLTSPTRV